MSSVVIAGDTSGQITLAAPAVAGTNTITLPASTGTAQLIGQGTAVNSTSGTAIDFTGIPSWAKRITVMFNGVSTSGTANMLMQIGSGSVTTSGYSSSGANFSGGTVNSSTAGFILLTNVLSTTLYSGSATILLFSGNSYVATSTIGSNSSANSGGGYAGGTVTLGGVMDRVRITTATGTDTFDAGSINILYEG